MLNATMPVESTTPKKFDRDQVCQRIDNPHRKSAAKTKTPALCGSLLILPWTASVTPRDYLELRKAQGQGAVAMNTLPKENDLVRLVTQCPGAYSSTVHPSWAKEY